MELENTQITLLLDKNLQIEHDREPQSLHLEVRDWHMSRPDSLRNQIRALMGMLPVHRCLTKVQ